jgi:hypothetical protein
MPRLFVHPVRRMQPIHIDFSARRIALAHVIR